MPFNQCHSWRITEGDNCFLLIYLPVQLMLMGYLEMDWYGRVRPLLVYLHEVKSKSEIKLFWCFIIPSSVSLLDGWDGQLHPRSWEDILPYPAIHKVNVQQTLGRIFWSLLICCVKYLHGSCEEMFVLVCIVFSSLCQSAKAIRRYHTG